MQAGWAVAKAGRRPGIAAMRAAFHDEASWGVRAEWAEALGANRSEAALDALLDWATKSNEPKSLPSVLRALGAYRDPRVVEVLEKRLDGTLGPRAQETALAALGAQREDAPIDRLVAATRRADFGGFAQSGALRGLAATRRAEALDTLIERTAQAAASPRVRAAATLAIGALRRVLEHRPRERALERLVDLLRDPERRVRAAAAQAIVDANAGEAIGAMEAYRFGLPPQDQSRLDRLIRRLRSDAPNPVKALEKEVETLRDKLQKLEDRLEKIEAASTVKT
jgi:HEAT repeat protein